MIDSNIYCRQLNVQVNNQNWQIEKFSILTMQGDT